MFRLLVASRFNWGAMWVCFSLFCNLGSLTQNAFLCVSSGCDTITSGVLQSGERKTARYCHRDSLLVCCPTSLASTWVPHKCRIFYSILLTFQAFIKCANVVSGLPRVCLDRTYCNYVDGHKNLMVQMFWVEILLDEAHCSYITVSLMLQE